MTGQTLLDLFGEPSMRILLWGLLSIFVAGGIWIMTSNRWALISTASLLGLFVGLIVVERFLVTDRETLRQIASNVARAVRENNVGDVKKHVSATRSDLKNRVEVEMNHNVFADCRVVSQRPIEIDRSGNRPRATYDITAYVKLDSSNRYQFIGSVTGNATLVLEKEADGVWRLVDYTVNHPAYQQLPQ